MMSEPVKRVSYLIEETPKDKQEWRWLESHHDGADATQRISFLRSTLYAVSFDFRLVRVEETRTVIE
jgi:hypothetical protein